jgi:hypothetical protein
MSPADWFAAQLFVDSGGSIAPHVSIPHANG